MYTTTTIVVVVLLLLLLLLTTTTYSIHTYVEDVCRSDRRAAGVGEESAQGARSCDLEGNRAGLGCLEHLRNALSFAVVTEWPVGV